MKYLKYIVGIIALLIILFIGKGMLTPEISYSSEFVVDKPIQEAWAVMNDQSKASQWLEGITNIEHISGTEGTVGAVTQYTFTDNEQESKILETMKEIRPNEHVAMDFVMEGVMTMDYKVDFTEQNGKTHIKSSTITTGEGMLMRSMVSFMQSSMQTQEDENMSRLKTLIEENKTNYFPILESETVQEINE